MSSSLQPIADAVIRLAKRQGFIQARDVRAELRLAGLPEDQWKDVIALTRVALVYRQGRYCHKEAFTPRLEKEFAQKQRIQKLIKQLIKRHRQGIEDQDRRGETRVDFLHPVKLRTEDGREHALMCRDLSITGVRLLGTQRLLGQKVQLELPADNGAPAAILVTRILWTCAVGDDLFENGGNFLEVM